MIKTICTVAALMVSTMSLAQTVAKSKAQDQFQLTGDIIDFPITIVNAFPFISGEVNGVKGKFMFDTGAKEALAINNNVVPLHSQIEKGNGQVGSGQKFKRYTNDIIAEIRVAGGLHFKNITRIESSNFDFIQDRITPDFIGFIGYHFFDGYLFKLDYVKRKLTFYENTDARETSKDYLAGENVVAILDFEIRKLPNHPMVKVKVNGVDVLVSFDTGGSYGLLAISPTDAEKLTKEKYLKDYGTDGNDDSLTSLHRVEMNPQLTTDFIGIYKNENDLGHVRKALGITEDNYMTLAYRFLAKYKTVWDYVHKKIYVLEY